MPASEVKIDMPTRANKQSMKAILRWLPPFLRRLPPFLRRRPEQYFVEILRRLSPILQQLPIFRASVRIRGNRKNDFVPKLVSIGPYFRDDGQEHLAPMEQLKPKFISEFLLALNTSQPVDPEPVTFRKLVGDVRDCYKEKVEYSDDDFLQILVRDSLFIIGIILLFQEEVPMSFKDGSVLEDMNIKGIRSDLLLLENQIPLTFIKEVYEWISDRMIMKDPKVAFKTIVEPFIAFDMPWKFNENNMEGAAHLLDLYWRCSLSPEIIKRMQKFPKYEQAPSLRAKGYIPVSGSKVIANATTLTNMARITFEKHCEGLDVHFSKGGIMRTKGTLHMPCLIIDSNQTTILANLIAFENSKSSSERIFHNYIKLMDDLVDSENDVELLQRCGVIHNKLSSHNVAATFFNDIGNYCLVDTNWHLFSDLYKDVQKHYSSNWNRRCASLHHNYFSSPWSRISVGAAATLLILSAAQTFYTIYAYYRPRH